MKDIGTGINNREDRDTIESTKPNRNSLKI